ncbi:hypothetical protein DFJ73DRAFT_766548 [Zopfochytrium polystomum]|nr:hypothetical protein DFJ73DRAFT_766548 [Zopfochytrium polystomum]
MSLLDVTIGVKPLQIKKSAQFEGFFTFASRFLAFHNQLQSLNPKLSAGPALSQSPGTVPGHHPKNHILLADGDGAGAEVKQFGQRDTGPVRDAGLPLWTLGNIPGPNALGDVMAVLGTPG